MRALDMEIREAIPEDHEDHDMEKPQELEDNLLQKDSHKSKPTWEQDMIQEAKRYVALEGIHKEMKMPNPCNIVCRTAV